MIQVEQHGDVTRFEMTSAASRIIGYSASAYLAGGVLVDCGFHGARKEMDAILDRERPRGVFITHYHEDHAGNVERIAHRGIPIAASTETLAKMRSPKPIRAYRRFTWRSAPPLRSPVTPFESERWKLVAAPGHCSDHHIVWDEADGTLFGGDLYLGIKVRIAHPGEDPRVLVRTLREVAALGPARLFDAHRGYVPNPTPLLRAKADWTEETIAMIEKRIASGALDKTIVRELFGGESVPGYLSFGDYSRTNFVKAVRRGMDAK
jgi:glyoxylase-like metal-dependent hydrolase (beta-lactamase superfamily II)